MNNTFIKIGLSAALLISASHSLAAKNPLTPSNKASSQPLATTKIVGGEIATQENWPWMTAYVVTYDEIATTLDIAGVEFETDAFSNGAAGTASGETIDCGIGDAVCAEATDKICVIERGEVNFSEKADNCEAGGGIGAIIYNNVEGLISGTMGDEYTGSIPVVAVTQEDGASIVDQIGSVATLSVSETTNLAQDSSCGASFLGDKWVLTAAHCVDSENASFFKMNVGEYDLSDGAENAIEIANVFIHPSYDDETFNNDIAIVELVSSVDAPPVQIASTEVTNQYATEMRTATVAGWGGRVGYEPGDEEGTSDFPDILHQVDLQLLSNQQCNDIYDSDGSLITANMLCAGITEGGKGSCQGDSGGPLVVNTSSGVEQVGIVSWGFGCASAGNPGVYTRVSEFKGWIDAITNGVAITQGHDFGLGYEGLAQTTELTVSNTSELNVALSFGVENSSSYSLDTTNCATLDAGSSCQLSVTYTPTSADEETAQLTVTTDNAEVKTIGTTVTGYTLVSATDLSASAGSDSDTVILFTGGTNGASGWLANSVEGLESGTEVGEDGDLQDSILVASIEGEGTLTFDWSVSSEENTDYDPTDPESEPFDALYLYVNDELVEFISGEVDFTEVTIDLAAGTNVINLTYSKDPFVAEGEDKGYVRNLVFTKKVEPVPVTPLPTQTSSGGGSLGWITLGLFGLLLRLRKKS